MSGSSISCEPYRGWPPNPSWRRAPESLLKAPPTVPFAATAVAVSVGTALGAQAVMALQSAVHAVGAAGQIRAPRKRLRGAVSVVVALDAERAVGVTNTESVEDSQPAITSAAARGGAQQHVVAPPGGWAIHVAKTLHALVRRWVAFFCDERALRHLGAARASAAQSRLRDAHLAPRGAYIDTARFAGDPSLPGAPESGRPPASAAPPTVAPPSSP